jgi:hypothetical protein
MLPIVGKHVTAFSKTSTGLDQDSCEDSLEQEEDDCDDDYDNNDDSDDESYKETTNNEPSTVALPVQRNTEDLLGYVSAQ